MAEEIKYLDYQGLSLYDQSIKDWGTVKNEEIKIKQTNSKSDEGTILVTPGGTVPATYYTAEEAEAYNTGHNLQPEDEGYKREGDIKTEAVTTNTNIEVNIDKETLVQDPTTKKIKVASAALTQYIGDKDTQNKYAINISEPDANNNKKVSLDINAESNAIEKTTTGVKVQLEIHPFANPETFGTNVKEAFALVANGVTLTGTNNEQVIKIYKDSSLLDMKMLHAVPATYYTAEEAAAYNEEHSLQPGDEGYKEEGDEKTAAVKPTYTKIGGWTDIASALRTEANLALCFAYENVDGIIVVEAVQVGDFLRENEFKAGLQVNDSGEVSVKSTTSKVRIADTPSGVTPGSDQDTGLVDVLTVDQSHGVQVDHIQEAIDYAAADSKTTLTEVAADSTEAIEQAGGIPKVVVVKSTDPTDHHTIYTITGQDLASAVALAAEVLRAQTAEAAIDAAVGLTKGANDETRTYSNTGSYIGKQTTNTVKSDIKALDTQLKDVTDRLDAMTAITNAEILALFA